MAEEIERIYTIPLRAAKYGISSKRADRAVKMVRKFISKHMKVDDDNVWMARSLNETLWSRGKYKCPSKLRVRVIKFEDGQVEVSLPEDEIREHREELKKTRDSKAPILKRELEMEDEESEEATEEVEAGEEPVAESEEATEEVAAEEPSKAETPEESEKKEE